MAFQKINDVLNRQGESNNKKPKKVQPWQLLGERICKELKVPKEEQKLIYKACYENPEPYIEHCFQETKELAKGELKHHYFIKLVYKKET